MKSLIVLLYTASLIAHMVGVFWPFPLAVVGSAILLAISVIVDLIVFGLKIDLSEPEDAGLR
jgi:hypothetical protein